MQGLCRGALLLPGKAGRMTAGRWGALVLSSSVVKWIFLFRPSSDLASFRQLLSEAQNVVVLTGAGVSAESGVPTFRGAGGFWRKFQVKFQFLMC